MGLWLMKGRLLPWAFLGRPARRRPWPSKEATAFTRHAVLGTSARTWLRPSLLHAVSETSPRPSRPVSGSPPQNFSEGTVPASMSLLCLAPRSTGAPAGGDAALCALACRPPTPSRERPEGRDDV